MSAADRSRSAWDIFRCLEVAFLTARSGLSTAQVRARLPAGISVSEFERALTELRDEGVVACTAGIWWCRGKR